MIRRTLAAAPVGALLLVLALARAGADGPTTDPVAGFLADARAGRPIDALRTWWDGEASAARAFPREWPDLPAPVRAEIGGVVGRFVYAELASVLQKAQQAGAKVSVTFGAPEAIPDVDGLPAMAVSLQATREGKTQSLRLQFLLTRSSPARLVDWAWEKQGWAATDTGRELARLGGPSPSADLLALVWRELGQGTQPPPGSLLFAPPAPPAPEWATRDLPPLALPVVTGPPADVALPVPASARWGPRLVLHVQADGKAHYRPHGRRSALAVLDLSAWLEAPEERAKGLDLLTTPLAEAAGQPGLRRPDGTSDLRLLVRADRRAPWKTVLSLASLAARPAVRVREVGFVTRGSTPDRPGLLVVPTSALVARGPADGPDAPPVPTQRTIQIKLFRKERHRRDEEQFTRIRIGETPSIDLPRQGLQPAEDAQAARTQYLAKVREALLRAKAELGAAPGAAALGCVIRTPMPDGPSVPVEDVLAAAQLALDLGLPIVELGADAG